MLLTCMGRAGMTLTLILWSRSVLTIKRPSGLTVRPVMMLQKCPMNSCGACRVPACQRLWYEHLALTFGGMGGDFNNDVRAMFAGMTSNSDAIITCSDAAVAATYTSPNLSAKIACSPSLVKVAALTFLGHFLRGAAR